jgi:hypothetical protein
MAHDPQTWDAPGARELQVACRLFVWNQTNGRSRPLGGCHSRIWDEATAGGFRGGFEDLQPQHHICCSASAPLMRAGEVADRTAWAQRTWWGR